MPPLDNTPSQDPDALPAGFEPIPAPPPAPAPAPTHSDLPAGFEPLPGAAPAPAPADQGPLILVPGETDAQGNVIKQGTTNDEIYAAQKAGRKVLRPGDTEPLEPVPPKPDDIVKQQGWDLSGYQKPPEPPGVISEFGQALKKGAVGSLTATGKAVTGQAFTDQPAGAKPPPQDPVDKLLNTPITEGWSDPHWWITHIGYGAGGMAVPGAAAAAGFAIGGPLGGFAGAALGTGIQELWPAYQQARAEGLPHDQAVDRAIGDSGIAGVTGGLMQAIPGMSFFGRDAVGALRRPISEALSRLFAAQPAVAVAGEAATQATHGKLITPEQAAETAATTVGGALPFEAAHMLRPGERPPARATGAPPPGAPGAPPAAPGAAPAPAGGPPAAPPGGAAPAAPAPGAPPAPGDVIHLPMARGVVQPMTVESVTPEGYVNLRDPDGNIHTMTADDIAARQQPPPGAPPPAAPAGPTAPAEPPPTAPGAPGGAAVAPPVAPPTAPPTVAPPEPTPRPPGPEGAQPPPTANETLQGIGAAEAGAAQGRPPPPAAQETAAAESELGAQAQPTQRPPEPTPRPAAPTAPPTAPAAEPAAERPPSQPPAAPAQPPIQPSEVPANVFGGDLHNALQRVFGQDPALPSVSLHDQGFAPDEVTALQRAGMANPDGTMTRDQFGQYQQEIAARQEAGRKAWEERQKQAEPPTPTHEEPSEPGVPETMKNLPDFMRDRVGQDYQRAAQHLLVDPIRDAGERGLTAQETVAELGTKLDPIRQQAQAQGWDGDAAAYNLVRSVRAYLGIEHLIPSAVPGAKPPEAPPAEPQQKMRLYRGIGGGPSGEGAPDGGWFTTDPTKAAGYGKVHYIDVDRDDLKHFAQGHGGPDEYFTDNKEIINRSRPLEEAAPTPPAPREDEVDAERKKLPEGWKIDYRPDEGYRLVRPDGTIETNGPSAVGMSEIAHEAAGTTPIPPVTVSNLPPEPKGPPTPEEIHRVAELAFGAHRHGGADAARVVFDEARKQGWPPEALDQLRELFARRLEDAGVDWKDAQDEAGTRPGTPTHEAPPAHPNTPVVTEETHTKTGQQIYVVRFPKGKPSIDGMGPQARGLGGYWSAYQGRGMKPGWIFKARDAADRFAAWATERLGAPPGAPEAPVAPPEPTPPAPEAPVGPETLTAPQQIAQDVAAARAQLLANPTGPKPQVMFHGVDLRMENAIGSTRSGTGENGVPWSVQMPADYGEINRTKGADGDKVDAYLGPDYTSQKVFVVDQKNLDGSFDEHKVMLGFPDWPSAQRTYLAGFSDGSGDARLGNFTPMNIDRFKDWLEKGDTTAATEPQIPPTDRPHVDVPRGTQARLPQHRIADWVETQLGRIRPEGEAAFTAPRLLEIAEREYGSPLSEGKFTRPDIYDAMELGVNQYIRTHAIDYRPVFEAPTEKMIVGALEKLKLELPTQTVRDAEKEQMQQFSTPPDYAHVAAWVANIGRGDKVMEPSAGTGSLVVPAMNASPAAMYVNEYSSRRQPLVESLNPTGAWHENAEHLHAILPEDVKPTVVVMNPPFSQAGERLQGRRDLDIGATHVEQALERLEPGGRLVAIVGRGMGENLPQEGGFNAPTGRHFADWWRRIKSQYDVRANIGIPGEVYGKYGTAFGTRLLVIDKNAPSGRPTVIEEARNLYDAIDKLAGVRNERQPLARAPGEQVAGQPPGPGAAPGGGGAPGTVPPLPGPTPGGGVRGGAPGAGPGEPVLGGTKEPGVPTVRPPTEPGEGGPVAPGEPGGGGPSPAEQLDGAPPGDGVDLAPGGSAPNGSVLRPPGSAGSILPGPGRPPPLDEPPPVAATLDQVAADPAGALTEEVYEPYKPQRIRVAGAKEHPGKLVQSAAMASVLPPPVDYKVRIPQMLIDTGALSEAQLEATTYAGAAHEQMLTQGVEVERVPLPDRQQYIIDEFKDGENKPYGMGWMLQYSLGTWMAKTPPGTEPYREFRPQGNDIWSREQAIHRVAREIAGDFEGDLSRPGAKPPASDYRRGYFIGDGTGVGKGREIGSVFLDNMMQGRKKGLWVSEKRPLLNDAQRDWSGLGRKAKEVFPIWNTKPGDDIAVKEGIGFINYDSLKSAEQKPTERAVVKYDGTPNEVDILGKTPDGKFRVRRYEGDPERIVDPKEVKVIKEPGQTRVEQIVKWLGKDFDGVIAFDESHNMGNSTQEKDGQGRKKNAAAKAVAAVALQDALPKARVLYVSATGATEVKNLAYMKRLGLWGPGTAFPNLTSFQTQIEAGGIAAMELVSRDMKAMGSYIARNLSYDGVDYDRVEHKLSPDEIEGYDKMAEGWQKVLNNMNAALAITGQSNVKHIKSSINAQFWGGHQRFFNQVITSIQMPSVLEAIRKDLAEGKQVVCQLVNTNEATAKRKLAAQDKDEELEELDLSPMDQLTELVDKAFPTQKYEMRVDPDGNEYWVPVFDSEGNPVEDPKAVALKKQLMSELELLRHVVPYGPLDLLMNAFGPDQVAEVTGRTQRLVYRKDERGERVKVLERRSGSANVNEANDFQNGKKKILVFSQAGGTGRSYHADNTAPSKGARRSHYLLQAGWRADAAIQGFGRTHRTNQASEPIFHLVTTDLSGQKRFISSIARRLSQLGALTKGERRAGESGMFSSNDNLESPEAIAGLHNFFRDLYLGDIEGMKIGEFEQATGLQLRDSSGGLLKNTPDIRQFLNRLLSLKFNQQNTVFAHFEKRLLDANENAAAKGTLDAGTETLRGDRIDKDEERTVYTDPASGAETKYVRLKVSKKSNPIAFDDVHAGRRMTRGEVPHMFIRDKQTGSVFAVTAGPDGADEKTGNKVPQYRLTDQTHNLLRPRQNIDGVQGRQRYERIEGTGLALPGSSEVARAREWWDEALTKVPEYETRDHHLITGAILPIWDRLGGATKVLRTQVTDTGERILGRSVEEGKIRETLTNLGADDAMKQYTPEEAAQRIMGEGAVAQLANEWRIRRARVGGENRMELLATGSAAWTMREEFKAMGLYQEGSRWYIPTGATQVPVLTRLLQRRPIVDITTPAEMASRQSEELGEPQDLASRKVLPTDDPAMIAIMQQLSAITGGQYRDMRRSYKNYAATRGDTSGHATARQWVMNRGEATGNEHYVALDQQGNIHGAGTTGKFDAITLPENLSQKMRFGSVPIDIIHNHPTDVPISDVDLTLLPNPSTRSISSHSPSGKMDTARIAPFGRQYFGAMPLETAQKTMKALANQAEKSVAPVIRRLIRQKKVTWLEGNELLFDMQNRVLDAAGLIDYETSRTIDPKFYSHLRNATKAILQKIGQGRQFEWHVNDPQGLKKVWDAEDRLSDALNHSTRTVLPDAQLARLSQADEGNPPGRAGPAGPNGDRDRGAAPAGAGTPSSLAARASDELGDAAAPGDDPLDEGTRETIRAALSEGPPGGAGWTREFFDMMGIPPEGAGSQGRDFNIINKDFTTPQTWGAIDPLSTPKFRAELAKFRDAKALAYKYLQEGLASWQGKDPALWNKLFSAMELLTLDGTEVPLDGRAVIVTNRDHPLARLSQVGQTIALTSPEEIQMFTAYRNTMHQVWRDLVTETARQFGWNGVPSEAAIAEAAERAPTDRLRQHLLRAAAVVGAIEYQERNAYLPLMRSGDYYFRVRPLGTGGDWNGEGNAPTINFELIDSRTPWDKVRGGMIPEVPKLAREKLDALYQQFPRDQYQIEHGYLVQGSGSASRIAQLDIPAVERLMMLIGSGAREQFQRRLLEGSRMSEEEAATAAQQEYNSVVDMVLDAVRQERVAGFRRQRKNIPGYSGDFAQSTSRYLNWLANYTSNLRHRPAIEMADDIIASHPSDRVKAFWRNFDRRQEDYAGSNDPLGGALLKARHGAFLWLLGMNAATTAKILLHGPLRGAPILSTGFGLNGRSMAGASYLNASRQMMQALRIGRDGITLDFNKIRHLLSPDEWALVLDSTRKGIIHEQTADEMAAVRGGGEEAMSPRKRFVRRVFDIWSSNVSAADRMVRGAMLLSAYRTAGREGMDTVNRIWDRGDENWKQAPIKTPETWAQFMVDKTVGIWGDINRIHVLRNWFGSLVGQFKTYEMGYLSNLHQMLTKMGPEGRVTAALMLGGMGMLGGAMALPFSKDIEDAVQWIGNQISSLMPNLDGELKNAMDAIFPGYGEAFAHGIRPFGVDLGSIGFGDLISRNMQSPLDLAGAAISMPYNVLHSAWQRYESGQGGWTAAYELMPNAVKHFMQAMYPEAGPQETVAGYPGPPTLAGADVYKKALGFEPESTALYYEKRQQENAQTRRFHQGVANAVNRIANLQARGEDDAADQARQDAYALIEQGRQARVFTAKEIQQYHTDLKKAQRARLTPGAPTPTQRRQEALQGQP